MATKKITELQCNIYYWRGRFLRSSNVKLSYSKRRR